MLRPGRCYFSHPYIGRGRATLAMEVSHDHSEVLVGVAFCSPNDQFRRDKGRMIAAGRLERGAQAIVDGDDGPAAFVRVPFKPDLPHSVALTYIMNGINQSDGFTFPSWAGRFKAGQRYATWDGDSLYWR